MPVHLPTTKMGNRFNVFLIWTDTFFHSVDCFYKPFSQGIAIVTCYDFSEDYLISRVRKIAMKTML